MGCNDPSNQIFQQGFVLRDPKFLLPDGRYRCKTFVVLNKNPTHNLIHSVLTTSQFSFYNRAPQWIKNQFVLIPAGAISFFRLKTLINCENIYTLPRLKLEEAYRKRRIEKFGILPKQFLDKIIDIIRSSILIETEIKESIL